MTLPLHDDASLIDHHLPGNNHHYRDIIEEGLLQNPIEELLKVKRHLSQGANKNIDEEEKEKLIRSIAEL